MRTRRIRCLYCGYAVGRRWRTVDGKITQGIHWMRKHLEEVHPQEYQEIIAKFGKIGPPGAGWTIEEE